MAKEVSFEAIVAINDREIEARNNGKQSVAEAKAALDAAWLEYRAKMEKELFDALMREPKVFPPNPGMIDPNITEFWRPSWMQPYIYWLKAKIELANQVLEPINGTR